MISERKRVCAHVRKRQAVTQPRHEVLSGQCAAVTSFLLFPQSCSGDTPSERSAVRQRRGHKERLISCYPTPVNPEQRPDLVLQHSQPRSGLTPPSPPLCGNTGAFLGDRKNRKQKPEKRKQKSHCRLAGEIKHSQTETSKSPHLSMGETQASKQSSSQEDSSVRCDYAKALNALKTPVSFTVQPGELSKMA
ncbi:hypothetical protein MHYP_G00048590 [Metynnis hypsauchen]